MRAFAPIACVQTRLLTLSLSKGEARENRPSVLILRQAQDEEVGRRICLTASPARRPAMERSRGCSIII
jgi:hypothetical protein